jgi:putative tricarboxylic transport membrane protein
MMVLLTPTQVGAPVLFFGAPPSSLSPRLFPLISAGLIIALGAIIAARGFRQIDAATWGETNLGGYVSVVISAVSLLVYALAFIPLGFVVSSAAVMLGLSIYYGNRNLLLGLAFAVFVPLGIFNLFTKVLLVLLPEATFLPPSGFM